MKFKPFKAPDISAWPVGIIQNWFKAHGPSAPIITANSFKDLFPVSSSPLTAPLAPSNSPLCTVNPSFLSSSASSEADSTGQIANIPIDPSQFVPAGFQVLQIEGRTAVQRVVLPRRARRHEDWAIVTITSLPEGQIHFANVRDVLHDFLVNVAIVGVKDIQKCPFGLAYV
jgi:hypothetical protein